jgi:hypothetical protein
MLAKGVVKRFLFFESLAARLIAELLLSGNLDQAIAQLDAPHDLWPQRHKRSRLYKQRNKNSARRRSGLYGPYRSLSPLPQ